MSDRISNKNIAVLYHADCPDGFGASFAAWKKFGPKAIYLPVKNQTLPPKEIEGKDVYLLDYCYTEKVLRGLLPKIKSLTVIDHHVTNEEPSKLANNRFFALDHSGAVLSWQYFHPKIKVPKFLKYIEDVDIWKFKMSHTKEVAAVAEFYDFDYKTWSRLVNEIETKAGFKKYLEQGSILVTKMEDEVAALVDNAEEVHFEGYKCLAVNSPVYVSFIGQALYTKKPPIAIIWSRRGNRMVVSLRSDGTVDVAKIAEKYGGGGHKAASAFSWEEKDFLKIKSREN